MVSTLAEPGGIVRSLPRKPWRRYIVVFLSNLGYRYYDAKVADAADFAKDEDGFPYVSTSISDTQRIPALGRRIDAMMRERQRARPQVPPAEDAAPQQAPRPAR
ncbi:hypothetical protein QEG98_01330 [Myxococcus sp. MxC21-1]|uniref:hypothetical protein n=1 Tax=Myxococcus sp. MxC21-1 TaxID=3041439 RepID=UPI0029306A45|nr:hypothetical protein [Myxococcus sp. MxC21-1]WNZ62518.1 hypothetical protein QEG98_01330 [Myxococcus sp. MxC21-1]